MHEVRALNARGVTGSSSDDAASSPLEKIGPVRLVHPHSRVYARARPAPSVRIDPFLPMRVGTRLAPIGAWRSIWRCEISLGSSGA